MYCNGCTTQNDYPMEDGKYVCKTGIGEDSWNRSLFNGNFPSQGNLSGYCLQKSVNLANIVGNLLLTR